MSTIQKKPKRTPIAKMIFLLRSESQKELFARKVNNLPVDAENPIQITISEQTKARGLDLNGLMWLRITEISQQVWRDGRQFDKDIWHRYLKLNEMPDEVEMKDGTIRSKWVEVPDGSQDVISTALLSAGFFSRYITIIEAFGASLGVMFSANPRENYRW